MSENCLLFWILNQKSFLEPSPNSLKPSPPDFSAIFKNIRWPGFGSSFGSSYGSPVKRPSPIPSSGSSSSDSSKSKSDSHSEGSSGLPFGVRPGTMETISQPGIRYKICQKLQLHYDILIWDHIRYQCYNFVADCTPDNAYTGKIAQKFAPNQITTSSECLEKCNSLNDCEYWDFGRGLCKLRSHSSGLKSASGYVSGRKHCKLATSSGNHKN